MRYKFSAVLTAVILSGLAVQAQALEPVTQVMVNDPRIFDLSTSATGYALQDGPAASAELNLIQGPGGALVGTVLIKNENLQTWGSVSVSGKVSVKGTLPLSMKLKGGGKGSPKVRITGTYDVSVKLMRVTVQVDTPEKLSYQWYDAFVPHHSDDTGALLKSVSNGAPNAKGQVKGSYSLAVAGGDILISTIWRPQINSGFLLKGKGLNLAGYYNPGPDNFSVFNSKLSVGYGTIFTPGSLVDVTTGTLSAPI